MSIQTLGLNPKPPKSVCPKCGAFDAGIRWYGKTFAGVDPKKLGNYCKFCLMDFIFENVPKTQKIEEKGSKENAEKYKW